MGDSTDANMETDVSSTTADVPDAQEVSGSSHDDMETIVIIEQVEEVKLVSNNNQSLEVVTSDNNSPKNNHTTQIEISPKKPNSPQKPSTPVPVNNPPAERTQIKTPISELESTPMELDKPKLKSPNKLVSIVTENPNIEAENVLEIQQSETIDSSNNVESQSSFKNETQEKSLEITVDTIQKEISEKTSPTKKSVVKEVDSEGAIEASVSNTPQEKLNDIDNVDSIDSSKHELIVDKNCCKTPIPVEINPEKEASNDSQLETNSDMSEKERKNISRELKSLINSAKESKIISECTQVTTKMRKSRTALDSSNTSLNTSVEPDKIEGQRRASNNSQKSNSSEKSEKVMKRSMRSQNPEFVNKVKQFLNSVTGKVHKNDTETGNQLDDELTVKQKDNQNATSPSSPKKKMLKLSEDLVPDKPGRLKSDAYCWRCHWGVDQDFNEKTHPPMYCSVCPRSFHYKCFSTSEKNKMKSDNNWVCPECKSVLQAESSDSRSPAMKRLSLGTLCELLNYALERMMEINGVEPFTHPVDRTTFPDYDKYVIRPMDLSMMKENIKKGLYGSTEAFHADAQWILHNSIIFNTLQSKLTGAARQLLRSCRAEMGEIEACPECYLAAHSRKPTWFIDVCSTPHILLWAKLKGFPYWPAKGMSVNNSGFLVDVRFFGAHDRAWVPARDCFLYSEKDPNNFRTKRQDIIDSMQEAEQHIRNISRKYGKFVYPPFRTPFEINKMTEQIKLMIPSFEGEASAHVKDKSFAASPNTSKTSKNKASKNEGDKSDTEEVNVTVNSPAKSTKTETIKQTSKTPDYAVTSVPIEVDKAPQNKSSEIVTRKRRRSELEEAVITVLESAPKEKRQKVDTTNKTGDSKKGDKAAESQPIKDSPQIEKQKSKENEQSTPKSKQNTPSGKNKTPTFVSKTPKINPLKIVLTPKSKTPKTSTPKSTDKSAKKPEKEDENNKSQSATPKSHKKKVKPAEVKVVSAPDKPEKPPGTKNIEIIPVKVTSKPSSQKEGVTNMSQSKQDSVKSYPSQKSTKDRIQFDDDTSLAVIARETSKSKSQSLVTNNSGLPTITSVRSLSDTAANTGKANKNVSKSADTMLPGRADNSKNSKETADKLQKIRRDNEPSLVGKVGVRAFARMTSPTVEVPITNNVQVEIKSEPIDLDDADRQVEKMDLMNAFRLRPVNQVTPPSTNLRDVRINKIVITPPNARKSTSKPPEGKQKAKKTFPQSKKDDGRSELNSKNSMVYIPIQPPNTQAPVRPLRPMQNGPVTSTTTIRTSNTVVSTGNSLVNTVTAPLIPNSIGTIPVTSSNIIQTMSPTLVASNQGIGQVGNMPLSSMPVLATMNGQWTLMPIMSVGGIDNASSPTLVNGIPDRSAPSQSIMPYSNLTLGNTTNLNTSVIPSSQVQRPGEAGLGDLPRLQQRPLVNPLDSSGQAEEVPTPSSAGPVTRKLNQNVAKLSDFFRHLLEDSIIKLDDPASQLTAMKLQLEESNWKHKHEVEELIHSHNLMLTEMRLSFEKEKSRAVNEIKKTMQMELDKTIKLTKMKQWCAQCFQEAQFYCCWNTSYCNYNCQREHWPQHFSVCTQQKSKNRNGKEISSEPESRLQPQPDNLPKMTKVASTPTLTVGGKVVTPDKNPKSAIIMSMVQDSSGNQAVKCLGTYKEPTYKQIVNNGEPQAAQNAVSSGGYLILGTTDSSPLGAQNQHVRNFFST